MTNWTLTLGALANRGAGTEAERAKLAATVADDRARLAGIEHERGAMVFTATDTDAVTAAKRAADTATKNREVECAKRGVNCRQRELDEQAAADKLATATTNKAATDRAARLDAEATTIRARLAKTPAVKEANTLGQALGRILSLSAVTAATAQQWLMSAIVELLIAGVLTLPELLRSKHPTMRRREDEPLATTANELVLAHSLQPPKLVAVNDGPPFGQVAPLCTEALEHSQGKRVEIAELGADYAARCKGRGLKAYPPTEFAAQLETFCLRTDIRTKQVGSKVFLLDVQLVSKKEETGGRLGAMGRDKRLT